MRIPQFTREPYWSIPLPTLFKDYVTSEAGLSPSEATRRALQYGKNKVQIKQKWVIKLLLSKFANPLVVVLFFANGVSALVGDVTSSLIIATILFISVSLDFFQEYQANRVAEKIKQRVALTANVLRDGRALIEPADQLTYGDVFFLSPGNIVPADGRLISESELQIDQALLTGETIPQLKTLAVEKADTAVSLRRNSVLMGTVVVSGQGIAVVTRIGENTELGKIGWLLAKPRPQTEFAHRVDNFGFFLLKVTFTLLLFVLFMLALSRHDVFESFLFALAIALRLTPELLTKIMTVTLARGAVRMASKGIIVKDLPSIQNLGSMDVLCTDKTGTLTEGVITLTGYEDVDGKASPQIIDLAWLNSTFQTTIRNYLDVAILNKKPSVKLGEYQKEVELTYDYQRKRVSVIIAHQRQKTLICKGMAESVLTICSSVRQRNHLLPMNTPLREKIADRITELNRKGIRVLAVASRPIEGKFTNDIAQEERLTFEGLLLFKDEPKASAAEALKLLELHQVEVKILTGDNAIVTTKICQELGLTVKGVLQGAELRNLNQAQLLSRARSATIFADLTPEDKRRIISALRNGNQVVGFLGDGISDALSLHEADVSISVNTGTDVAKESADLILMHKDLYVLKDGELESRKTYANGMKYMMMGTSSNFGNMLSVSIASIVLPFIPLLPIQLLLNNLLHNLSQSAIPSDRVDAADLRKPHRLDLQFIRKFMYIFGPVNSCFDLAAGVMLLLVLHSTPEVFRTGVFIASFVTQSFIIFSIRTSKVPFLQSKVSRVLVLSMFLSISAALLLPISPLASLFKFAVLPFQFYLFLACLVVVNFTVTDWLKKWFYGTMKARLNQDMAIAG